MRKPVILGLFATLGLAAVAATLLDPATDKVKDRSMRQVEVSFGPTSVVFAQTEPVEADPEEEPGFGYNYGPSLFVKDDSGVFQSELKDFKRYMWEFGASHLSTNYFVGVLEHTVEGPAWELNVVFSRDGGRSWNASSVKKPTYWARFESLVMDDRGHGLLTARVDADAMDAAPGDYVYETSDWGQSWSEGTLSPSKPSIQNRLQPGEWHSDCAFSQYPTETIPPECALPEKYKSGT